MKRFTLLFFVLAALNLAARPARGGYQAATALDIASPEASDDDGSGPRKPHKPIRADDVAESPEEPKSEPKEEMKKSRYNSKSVEEPAEEDKGAEPEMPPPDVVETKYSDEKADGKGKYKGDKGGDFKEE